MSDLIPVDAHIHRSPPGNKLVSRIPVRTLPSPDPSVREMIDMEYRKPDFYWGKVNAVYDGLVSDMKRLLVGKVPEHVCDRYGDLLGGPFRLDFDTFSDRVKPGELGKEASARIQHNLAHNLFYGATEGADPAFSDNMYKILKMHHDLFERSQVAYSSSLHNFWSGVKSELAVAKVLTENGYTVILPNYAEEPNDFGMTQEVLDWDVRSGVDLVAAKHGQVYLLDVKGRLADEGGFEDDDRKELRRHVSVHANRDRRPKQVQWGNLPNSLRGVIDYCSPERDWRRGLVMIPTAPGYLRAFREPPEGTSPKAELQRFATFTDKSLPNTLLQGIIRLQAF
ncbi:MAG: hypothetical protein HZC02_01490 [Candidatus Levybacteria bacterium]|nr:hypothetical protein [Candidatus Levybacteria bacterium]